MSDSLLTKRKVPEDIVEEPQPTKKVNQARVASHYNARKDQGLQKRTDSPIYHLRNFNNWMKSILIAKYIKESDQAKHRAKDQDTRLFALDLACGKMGDALKWVSAKATYVVGVDIAEESLKDGLKRYYDRKMNFKFGLSLICADCTTTDIVSALPSPDMLFDICSCQFALHYSFGSEEQARMMIKNAASSLRKGGYFVGTIPNASVLLEKVKAEDGKKWSGPNDLCVVDFDENVADLNAEDFHFGIKYTFTLLDAIDGCPEYLISEEDLKRIGKEFDLELIELKPFKEMEKEHKAKNKQLWNTMKVEGLTDEQREVVNLYQVFAFRKMQGKSQNIRRTPKTVETIQILS